MKTTVKEFKAFIDDDEFWPEGAHYEYDSFTVNGISDEDASLLVDDEDASIEIKDGYVIIPTADWEYGILTLGHFFRKWRKSHAN